ncbi:P1 family peptidase [Plantactinospora sp. KBS50]|uniref:P1 family peptidase n=1 Tax=Plantactinospora sp. KBS50 TaxID=2024580 RepID=UPI000BAAD462|nr:P1 family peptidase [Plantactinospora sp. KBS50]ASW55089.1 aminopeptidase [Plantactinospora sp. KBS50]
MPQPTTRARDLGVVVGPLPTGPHNAITDVPGVLVGHTTVDDGHHIHTGVTAVVPDPLGPGSWTRPAAVHRGNGYGKLVGSTQVDELGVLESPIVLTATLSVFRAADAVLDHLLARRPDALSVNPLVGETNDGYLSDIRRRPITAEHVLAAITGASAGPPAEGCVGAGTGTAALGYKAGIGTASRTVAAAGQPVTIGTLVQANFGGTLTVAGIPLPAAELLPRATPGDPGPVGNSCMIVLATDAPLDARQLGRLARRAVFAMARVGASYSTGSGDYAIAFGTAAPDRPPMPDADLDPVFAAVLDSVEEALLNSLFTATTTRGVAGHIRYAVPHEAVVRRLAAAGRLAGPHRFGGGR